MQINIRGANTICFDRMGNGDTIVFIHGFPLDRRMWNRQHEPISQRHQIVAMDLPGFGESPAVGDTMRMEEYAAVICDALDAMDVHQPVTLCGLSMGGYIAFAFNRAFPDRVKKMVLCDTKSESDTPEKQAERRETANQVLREGTRFLAKSMPPNLVAKNASPSVLEQVESMMTTASPTGVAAALRGMSERDSATSWLHEIDVPTLVVCGEEDAISPVSEMQVIANAIPNAQFEVVPHAGHLSPLENPNYFNPLLLDFLDA